MTNPFPLPTLKSVTYGRTQQPRRLNIFLAAVALFLFFSTSMHKSLRAGGWEEWGPVIDTR